MTTRFIMSKAPLGYDILMINGDSTQAKMITTIHDRDHPNVSLDPDDICERVTKKLVDILNTAGVDPTTKLPEVVTPPVKDPPTP